MTGDRKDVLANLRQVPFLRQGRDSCCFLYALCNARRALGGTTPAPGAPEWERLVDVARCRHGSTIGKDEAARELGLRLTEVNGHDNIVAPAVVSVVNPEPQGMHLHSALCVAADSGWMLLVNYWWVSGPLVEWVPLGEIEWPPTPQTDRHFNITDNTNRQKEI